ncbi:hypothetical protein ACFV5N_19040 [Streptomyces sp. NPDC059853]
MLSFLDTLVAAQAVVCHELLLSLHDGDIMLAVDHCFSGIERIFGSMAI